MVYLLTAFGHEVLEAHDGSEGIERTRKEKPDLILLDIHMPQMDGYEAARRLGKMPECYGVPIVAVTALAMVGDREKIMASGFNGYIAKPIDPESFSAQVQSHLRTAPPPQQPIPIPQHKENAPVSTAASKKFAVVLFVDNMQTNIDLVRSVLEPSGYEVCAALSAREGIDLAQRTKPDLIVSDVHMPHQDGYEFLRMIQAIPGLCEIPFVFLSSSVWSIREQQQALVRGADKFIPRPIEPGVLLSELEEVLHKKKGA
jgi:two-component system cell cycle response regulator